MEILNSKFKGVKINILLKLYLLDYQSPKKAITLVDMEKRLGYGIGRPDVRQLFKYLINEGALEESDKLYGYRLFYIEKKILKKIMDAQETLQLYNKCFWKDIP